MKLIFRLFVTFTLSALLLQAFPQKAKIDSLLHILSIAKQDKEKAIVLLQLGENYTNLNPDSALLFLEDGFALAKKSNQRKLIADFSTSIGKVYYLKGLFDRAIEYYLDAIKILEDFSNSPDKATAKTGKVGLSGTYGNLGNILMKTGSYDKAIVFFNKAFLIYEELENKVGVTNCLMSSGNIYLYKGSYEEANKVFTDALLIYKTLNDKVGIANCYNNIGIIQMRQGKYADAMNNFLNALKVYEELNHKVGISNCYLNIGIIYKQQLEYVNAIDYFNRALTVLEILGDLNGKARVLNNIGNTYLETGQISKNRFEKEESFKKAIEYYKKTEKIRLDKNDLNSLPSTYVNIGNVYSLMGSYHEAIDFYTKALKIEEKKGDKYGISSIYKYLSENYITITDSLSLPENLRIHYLNLSVEYGKKSFEIAHETGTLPLQVEIAKALLKASIQLGNKEQALLYADILNNMKDSLYNQEKYNELAEFQAKYENEKKQQEIEKQQLVIEKQEIDNKRQMYLLNFFIAGSVLLALLAVAIFQGYQQKKRSNAIVTEKNEMLEQANAEISAQRDLVVNQKEKIEEVNRNITESLRYARSIQAAILPSEKVLKQISPDSFMLMKPCELVSGDFFWATSFDDYNIFCVSDCTGHGVPGAFMSILGITELNNIVVKHRVVNPGQILDQLRESVIETLSHNDPNQLHKDGMDISICVLNAKTRELQFAGAGLPLWLLVEEHSNIIETNSTPLVMNGFSLHEIKGNNMPVGSAPNMKPFSTHVIQLQGSKASIYLATDGFADQFGGPNGKKFKVANLRSLLLEISHLSMLEQHQMLENVFEQWRGSLKQVDDVTILGLKV